MHGTLLFDDFHLPFADPKASQMTARFWLGGVRPLLMLTYWANFLISGANPFSYHVVNVILHVATALLMFSIFKHVLSLSGSFQDPKPYALVAAALFLLHPLQTESVAYIAGRSELLSGLFFCAAWLVFLRRFDSATRVVDSLLILLLGAAAVLSKENAICLPAVLFATDVYWAKGSFVGKMRRRLNLYIPIVLGALAGSIWILRGLTSGTAAGFSLPISPFQYALTQSRVILLYIRLFFIPLGQNGDWQISFFRSLADQGAWLYLIAIVALIAAAVRLSSRLRLISFGIVIFLLMLAPTSSVVPISDAMAERRMYMPITGLILVVIGLAARLHLTGNRQRILASACVVLVAGLSWQRSAVWSSPLAFWDDCLRRVPGNLRARMGYGSALLALHECKPAVQEFIRARSDDPNNPTLEWNLASAYECDNQYEPALPLFQSFAGAHPSADAWNHIAYNQLKLRQLDEAAGFGSARTPPRSRKRHIVHLSGFYPAGHEQYGWSPRGLSTRARAGPGQRSRASRVAAFRSLKDK